MGGASRILMLLSTPSPLSSPSSSSSTAVLRLARRHRSRLPHSTSTSIRQLSSKSKSNSSPLFPPKFSFTRAQFHTQTNSNFIDPLPPPIPKTPSFSHPWPEWSTLLDRLASAGYSDRPCYGGVEDDSFVQDVPEEFARAAEACLAFARDRTDLLRLLSKKNIEVIVENGLPLLFRNGRNSERRMRLFLSGGGSNVIESEKVQTFDVMRYVLSYAYSSLSTSDGNALKGGELVEASIRSLLGELINLSGTVRETKVSDLVPRHPPSGYEQFSRSPGQNIEMKRGDWICSKCSFMNFARNTRCLECDEVRPKRQLTGAEWECPQCDFFNYGKNMSCLRCDCKRPGETQSSTGSIVDRILGGSNIERRLAVNDEKAEKWFSKVSQLDDAADLSSAGADDDFPEIMPLRKGVNKFVVSNRKTPLERRLANSQSGIASGVGSNRPSDSSMSQSLDRILGRTSAPATGEDNTGTSSRFNSSDYSQSIAKADPNHVPFVPLPPDMFKKPQNSSNEAQHKEDTAPINAGGHSDSMSMSTESPTHGKKDGELSDASEKWFKKTADTDLDSTVADDDFPDIMPMRKGENRFVVSKKKDRSLTSPQYKRRLAIEQANSSSFVPFVPFPPDYFAKKDKQPEGAPVSNKEATAETSGPPERVQTVAKNLPENKVGAPNWGSASDTPNQTGSRTHNNSYSTQFSGKNMNDMKVDNSGGSWNSGISQRGNASNGVNVTGGFAQQAENPQNARESWNKGFSGKSLEGSAVKETDPLDMSEEAKAERWFRRVAQIKDISELSQIPDEDFPEIMPMRKGVNRFVVSKRKTPLERRLTSPQYRRNLPIVSSDPEKDDS